MRVLEVILGIVGVSAIAMAVVVILGMCFWLFLTADGANPFQ